MIYARRSDHGPKGIVIQGLSGVDTAFWDIKGKHFNDPCAKAARERTADQTRRLRDRPAAAQTGRPIGHLAEVAATGYVAEGFRAVKLKVGFGVENDAAPGWAVREVIRSTVNLMGCESLVDSGTRATKTA
ncbi:MULTISPECIES: hypothetical protein [unclassified Bradyrhizobium]|uniref:hypothetical protein n=1 Tax=unclassified Bradyrhizobium TaxID=2631580 RepID=UPI001CD4B108|nr:MULTISPECIES: hypothetical protein [unclassified Bradyrhizobium]MCA1378656.1 hypothetical protein [Bradyrhizobium sp. IC4060]MCA1487736.1 hypothetical protein [Bradyrhizobium sp. IC4061]